MDNLINRMVERRRVVGAIGYNGAVFTFTGLQKAGDDAPPLHIDSLTVGDGEIVALVGPAHSGKETLQALITGRERPSAGLVRVSGLDPVAEQDALSRTLGVLFAEDRLYPRQSALGNLTFYTRLQGLDRQRAAVVLGEVGLGDQGNTRAAELSSGQSRRLALGRAILHQPGNLLLVEPFDRCDEDTIRQMRDIIHAQAETGVAVLILASNTAQVQALADTIYPLENGRLKEAIRPDEAAERLPFKIAVRMEGRVALINPADILFAEASDGRIYLQTTTERLATPFTMTELEQRLSRQGFFRAHRSYLVNLQHVGEIIPYTRSSFSLKLSDAAGTKVPLSKESAAELRDLLDY